MRIDVCIGMCAEIRHACATRHRKPLVVETVKRSTDVCIRAHWAHRRRCRYDTSEHANMDATGEDEAYSYGLKKKAKTRPIVMA